MSQMDIIDTIGLEIEFANLPIDIARNLKPPSWKIVQDGSTRTYRPALLGVEVKESGQELVMFGGEFVSPPFDVNKDWQDDVKYLLDALTEYGEGVDDRTSIHFHVNCNGFPLFALKNLITIGKYLEAGFFRLSCAEAGIHRGVRASNYGFCRPITNDGPAVSICSDGHFRQVFTTETLFRAENQDEFKMALGRMDRNGGNKYHEARYVWLNFASLYLHGSIEFRPFNFTSDVRNLEAWASLCTDTVRCAFGKLTELPTNSLGSEVLPLDELLEFLMVTDEKVIFNLQRLWNMSSYQRGVDGYQSGHLGHEIHWKGVPNRLVPPIVPRDEVNIFNGNEREDHSLQEGFYLIRNFKCVD